jgi:hypothetical protein
MEVQGRAVGAYINQAPTRLEVVASDDDPRITSARLSCIRGECSYHTAASFGSVVLADVSVGLVEQSSAGG